MCVCLSVRRKFEYFVQIETHKFTPPFMNRNASPIINVLSSSRYI